ncbi:hypothetical protein [Victivallis sp. Marseille-Q1083]|uniref:hypothetical protein n=1 Tax=Victivallis sp. Marseille-Q1083 TaxID=2717288 RepID=UPI00158B1B6B|nr:hypothetical protein [Victivallis sp. Marseille-Q1083]
MGHLEFAEGVLGRLAEYLELLLTSCWWISIIFLILYFILISAWLASGFYAATVAELANHPLAKHFLLGLVMPYYYPIQLAKHIEHIEKIDEQTRAAQEEENPLVDGLTSRLKNIRMQNDVARRERRGEDVDEEAIAAEVEASLGNDDANAGGGFDEEMYDDVLFDRDFFENLEPDAEGIRQGPFRVVMKDGTEYRMDAVTNIQDTLAGFVVSDTGKRIRLKYENIASFEPDAANHTEEE